MVIRQLRALEQSLTDSDTKIATTVFRYARKSGYPIELAAALVYRHAMLDVMHAASISWQEAYNLVMVGRPVAFEKDRIDIGNLVEDENDD
ncbi:MAG: hypothetical protein GX418_02045 [Clostridiales bacterium]|nr:hypothetical protein [Clostridiales bacterium]